MSGVFISHAHSDAALARALATLIETLLRGKIQLANCPRPFRLIQRSVRDAEPEQDILAA